MHTHFLIVNETFTPQKISVRTNEEIAAVIALLRAGHIPEHVINLIHTRGPEEKEDIYGYFTFNQNRPQKRLTVEAKGGDVYYNIYTMLGQFLVLTKSPSSYYWFALALPASWQIKVKEYLTNDGEIKPIINDIILKYTKRGQGLYFYFVNPNGTVNRKTWRQTLLGR